MNSNSYKGYADDSLVVSVDEASKLVEKLNVIFIDTRNYWKYAKGHIPGAYNLELYAFHWVDTSRDGIEAYAKEMQMLFRSLGIEKQKQVILYQNNSGYDAARGVWLLNFFGQKNARLLDGGSNLWKRMKLPLSKKDPLTPKQSQFVAKPDPSVVVSLDFLASSVRNKSVNLIDARNQGEFSGVYHRALKTGHIPGAMNVEWKVALRRDGTLKNAEQLRKLYSGISEEGQTVTYCQSGYRAAHSWLVLKLLGYKDVRNYLGSWYEWGNSSHTPTSLD